MEFCGFAKVFYIGVFFRFFGLFLAWITWDETFSFSFYLDGSLLFSTIVIQHRTTPLRAFSLCFFSLCFGAGSGL